MEGAEDIILVNWWLKRAKEPGRITEMSKPLGMGHRPSLGHEEGAREPIRFCVLIKDTVDIAMLVIPEAFQFVMKQ